MLTKYSFLKIKLMMLLLRKGKLSLRKLYNMTHCYVAYGLRLDRSGTAPIMINFELSNHCNESCVFCRSKKGTIYDLNPASSAKIIPKGSMKLPIYEQIIRQTKDSLLMAVPYVNGEPFIYKHLDDVLRIARENRVGAIISTNGLLLNETNINNILDNDLDLIKVHVSGYTTPIHQIQHRVGDVEKIKNNLRMLARKMKEKRARLLVLVDYILYKHNRHEVELFRQFADEHEFMFSTRPGNPLGMEGQEDPQPEKLATHIPCDFLWKGTTVNWNGDVLPCCDYVVWGNTDGYGRFEASETDFLKMWNGDKVIGMRRIHRTQGRAPIPICSGCNRTGIEYKY